MLETLLAYSSLNLPCKFAQCKCANAELNAQHSIQPWWINLLPSIAFPDRNLNVTCFSTLKLVSKTWFCSEDHNIVWDFCDAEDSWSIQSYTIWSSVGNMNLDSLIKYWMILTQIDCNQDGNTETQMILIIKYTHLLWALQPPWPVL